MKRTTTCTLFTILALGLSCILTAEAATPPLVPPLFGWQVWPASGERILPGSLPPPTATNASLKMVSARGATASASFAIRSMADFKALTITPGNLKTKDGATLPARGIDLRIVKCWYQDANGWFASERAPGNSILVPELLLHDDTLVRIDPKTHENLIRTSPAGGPAAYRRIKAVDGGAVVPAKAFSAADDAKTLQPFHIAKKEARQLYLLLDIPASARPGLYHGQLVFSADGRKLGHFDLDLRVINHQLPDATSRFSGQSSLDGKEVVSGSTPAVITTDPEPFRSIAALPTAQLTPANLAFLFETGLTDPVLPPSVLGNWKALFGARKPETLWIAADGSLVAPACAAPSPKACDTIAKAIQKTGVQDLRIFLTSRPSGKGLAQDIKSFEALDNTGAKVWAFVEDETYERASAFIQTPMRRGYPPTASGAQEKIHGADLNNHGAYGDREYSDTRQAERWHAIGVPFYLCSTLPAGVEDPSVWRRRLGAECFFLGYDGFVLPALLEPTDPWNDWAAAGHRSRTFLYPTKNGFVPTLAWEGVREAILDVRYLSSVRRLANTARVKGKNNENPLLDLDGRRASMWIDWLPVQRCGLDTMRLDAIAWIDRLELCLSRHATPNRRK